MFGGCPYIQAPHTRASLKASRLSQQEASVAKAVVQFLSIRRPTFNPRGTPSTLKVGLKGKPKGQLAVGAVPLPIWTQT